MDIQDDLFGGSALVGATRAVKRDEAAQCLGQTDVFSQLANMWGTDPADVGEGYCPRCERDLLSGHYDGCAL